MLKNSGDYISGEAICKELGVSRAYVWKLIKALREEGYEIDAVSGRGYRLSEIPDVLSESEIKSSLSTRWMGHDIVYFSSTDSTNTQAKLLAEQGAADGTLVASDMQTGGKGRRGRTWVQKSGENISMSILLRPSFDPDRASMLTLLAAMAVRKAAEELTGMRALIKWPNDIVINGKKICGILTEMSAEQGYIHYVVTGIGINVNGATFPDDIKDTASSLFLESGSKVSRSAMMASVLKAFEEYYEGFSRFCDLSFIRDEYNAALVSMDREVCVLDPKGQYTGISRGINEAGELLVATPDGSITEVSSGEVSVRGIYGYV